MSIVNTQEPLPFVASSEVFTKTYKSLSERYSAEDRCNSFPHIVASPMHYESGYAYPLIVWLHDAGKSEREIVEVAPKISSRNYVAVAPRGLKSFQKRIVRSFVNGRLVDKKSWEEPCNNWTENDEDVSEAENLVFDAITEACAKYNVNRRRIFLLGRGTGGSMALRVAMRNPDYFAGVASIDGALPSLNKTPFRKWRFLRDLPVLITVGDSASTTVPRLDMQMLRLYHTAGLTVLVRQYNEDPTQANSEQTRMSSILADVNRWIMERTLNPQTTPCDMFVQHGQKENSQVRR